MGKKSKKSRQTKTINKKMASTINEPSVIHEDSAAIPSSLAVGDRVTLKDLKSAKYNGKAGEVASLPEKGDLDRRHGILLDGSAAPIAIRKENIALIHEDSTGFSSPLAVGDRITLKGLKSTKYNGKVGKVASLPEEGDLDSRHGIILDGTTVPIAIRKRNIISIGGKKSRRTTEQLRRERDKYINQTTRVKGEYAEASQLSMMRTMMNMFMTEEMQIKMFGYKIDPLPNYYEEIMVKGLPGGTDPEWAKTYLRQSFEECSGLPHLFEMHLKSPEWKLDGKDAMKRLGTNDREKINWYFGERNEHNEIFSGRTVTPYAQFVRHSYSNQCYREEVLHLGTTHVGVGFVDLGMLLTADLRDPPSNSHSGPLNFLGIESSPYQVAKTAVIWEMIKHASSVLNIGMREMYEGHLRAILQAWYSSSWDESTENLVRKALHSVCSSNTETYHPSVWELLKHWLHAETAPLREARYQISTSTSTHISAVAHMLRKRDRLALAQYELTRDFCLHHRPFCGNLLMFSCPDGTPPMDQNETVFSALPFKDIMEVFVDNCRAGRTKKSIIDAAETYALTKIKILVERAQREKITLQLICGDVKDLTATIASQRPWTMSWSNVLDYFDYKDFHQMARSCSLHGDTVHYGYSMNWSRDVFGTNILDHGISVRSDIIDEANKAAKKLYQNRSWDAYLRLPPPCNPINTTGGGFLEIGLYKKWCHYFFSFGSGPGICNVAKMEHIFGSPLSPTGGSTTAFTWSYDPDVVFNLLEYA